MELRTRPAGTAMAICLALLSLWTQPVRGAAGDHWRPATELRLRGGPGTEAPVRRVLRPAESLVEIDRDGDWVLVSVRRSLEQGWVYGPLLRPLKAAAAAGTRPGHRAGPGDEPPASSQRSPAAAAPAEPVAAAVRPGARDVPPGPVEDRTREAARAKAPPPWWAAQRLDLARLGHEDGIVFEGARGTHVRVIGFPLPRDGGLRAARLRLWYRASPLLNRLANLRVEVDGRPVRVHRLEADGGLHRLDIGLDVAKLRPGHVVVTLKASLPVSDDRCMDDRINGSVLHLTPESALELRFDRAPQTVRDLWQRLPETVDLALPPGTLDPGSLAVAWSLADRLRREGHRLRLRRLPELGQVVVARRAELRRALHQRFPAAYADTAPVIPGEGDAHAGVVPTPAGPLLLLAEPHRPAQVLPLLPRWRPLAAAGGYRAGAVDTATDQGLSAAPPATGEALEVPLRLLGLDTGPRYIRTRAEWGLTLDPQALPPGSRPRRLELGLVTPPRVDGPPFELYTYLNGVLVQADRFLGNGRPVTLTVPLPRRQLQVYNRIRLLLLHDVPMGDCHAGAEAAPVQILPDSTVIVARHEEPPVRFADLTEYLDGDFELYVPGRSLSRPERILPVLAELSAGLPLAYDFRRLHVVDPGQAIRPTGPFLAVGDLTLAELEAPVRFDRGRVQIADSEGRLLLDLEALPGIAVAQIVEAAGQRGLWLRTAPDGSPVRPGRLLLNDDDVAFLDAGGIVLTLDSTQPTLARVHYPDQTDWIALMGRYRFWLLALAWLGLTAIIVYLFRLSRRHRHRHGGN